MAARTSSTSNTPNTPALQFSHALVSDRSFETIASIIPLKDNEKEFLLVCADSGICDIWEKIDAKWNSKIAFRFPLTTQDICNRKICRAFIHTTINNKKVLVTQAERPNEFHVIRLDDRAAQKIVHPVASETFKEEICFALFEMYCQETQKVELCMMQTQTIPDMILRFSRIELQWFDDSERQHGQPGCKIVKIPIRIPTQLPDSEFVTQTTQHKPESILSLCEFDLSTIVLSRPNFNDTPSFALAKDRSVCFVGHRVCVSVWKPALSPLGPLPENCIILELNPDTVNVGTLETKALYTTLISDLKQRCTSNCISHISHVLFTSPFPKPQPAFLLYIHSTQFSFDTLLQQFSELPLFHLFIPHYSLSFPTITLDYINKHTIVIPNLHTPLSLPPVSTPLPNGCIVFEIDTKIFKMIPEEQAKQYNELIEGMKGFIWDHSLMQCEIFKSPFRAPHSELMLFVFSPQLPFLTLKEAFSKVPIHNRFRMYHRESAELPKTLDMEYIKKNLWSPPSSQNFAFPPISQESVIVQRDSTCLETEIVKMRYLQVIQHLKTQLDPNTLQCLIFTTPTSFRKSNSNCPDLLLYVRSTDANFEKLVEVMNRTPHQMPWLFNKSRPSPDLTMDYIMNNLHPLC